MKTTTFQSPASMVTSNLESALKSATNWWKPNDPTAETHVRAVKEAMFAFLGSKEITNKEWKTVLQNTRLHALTLLCPALSEFCLTVHDKALELLDYKDLEEVGV